MEHCNGYTHSEMTDAYDCYSYPCPGPERCSTSKLPPQSVPTPPDPPDTPTSEGYNGPWDQLPKGGA